MCILSLLFYFTRNGTWKFIECLFPTRNTGHRVLEKNLHFLQRRYSNRKSYGAKERFCWCEGWWRTHTLHVVSIVEYRNTLMCRFPVIFEFGWYQDFSMYKHAIYFLRWLDIEIFTEINACTGVGKILWGINRHVMHVSAKNVFQTSYLITWYGELLIPSRAVRFV